MDPHVEEPTEGGVTSSDKPDPKPGGEGHDAVVDHVEGGQVAELLTEQEEEGVDEVNELGEEIPPSHVGSIQPILGVAEVHRLAQPVVLPSQPESAGLLEYPDTEQGLEQVVHDHQVLYVEGLPVLHEPGPRHSDDVVVEDTQSGCGPGGRHQQPVINPGIPEIVEDMMVLTV